MAQITIEESLLKELIEKAAKDGADAAYRQAWCDAASATRIFADKVRGHGDAIYLTLQAVADSLEEAANLNVTPGTKSNGK